MNYNKYLFWKDILWNLTIVSLLDKTWSFWIPEDVAKLLRIRPTHKKVWELQSAWDKARNGVIKLAVGNYMKELMLLRKTWRIGNPNSMEKLVIFQNQERLNTFGEIRLLTPWKRKAMLMFFSIETEDIMYEHKIQSKIKIPT